MGIHTFHDSTLVAGLQDGCPACESKARDPLSSLDGAHLSQLWRQMLRVEFGDGGSYRSAAEAGVCRRFYDYARFLERIGINPRDVQPGVPYAASAGDACPRCGDTAWLGTGDAIQCGACGHQRVV